MLQSNPAKTVHHPSTYIEQSFVRSPLLASKRIVASQGQKQGGQREISFRHALYRSRIESSISPSMCASGVRPKSDSSSLKESFTIAVVGGGLAGVTLAIGLLHQGVSVHIYESAPAFFEIGSGIRLGPHAVKALCLIDPRIKDAYWKCATFNSRGERGEIGQDFRWGQDCRRNGGEGKAGDLIWHWNWGEGHEDGKIAFSAVHRARFLDELIKLLPEGVASFGKRLKDVVELEHAVRLSFEDGSSAEHSAVIGCDGIKSKTRHIMYPEAVPQFAGDCCYRGLVTRGAANALLGEDAAGNFQMYCGYGGYIICYPVDEGTLMNITAVRRAEKKEWSHERWVLPSSKEDILRDFNGWEPKLVELLLSIENKDRWACFDVPLDKSYAKGKMCVLGDAAHASTNHLGSGAGMAFEDAYIMSNVLGAVCKEKDVPVALQVFDSVRRKRTLRLVLASRQAGLANQLSKEGVTDDLLELQKDINSRYRWIWDVDFELMRREALTKMSQLV